MTAATLALVALAVFVPLAIEARRAARNERRQIARGGVEPAGDVYTMMRAAYPGAFVAMLVEGAVRHVQPALWLVALGAAVFAGGKVIKWSAIAALGEQWTFRVIVVPGDRLVTRGPYRWLRHPNYVGVMAVLVGTALMTRALVAGPLAVVLFGALVLRRITVENRALGHSRA
jgi:methyltransferase